MKPTGDPRSSIRRDFHSRALSILSAALVGAAGLLIASPSYAQDERACVSLSEFEYLYGKTVPEIRSMGLDRKQLEIRWEVRHRGVRDGRYGRGGQYARTYPACGYDLSSGQVTAVYNKRTDELEGFGRTTNGPALPGEMPRG